MPSFHCHHILLLLNNSKWCPDASRPNSNAWLPRPSTFWPPPHLPYTHPSPKTRLFTLVKLIPAANLRLCHSPVQDALCSATIKSSHLREPQKSPNFHEAESALPKARASQALMYNHLWVLVEGRSGSAVLGWPPYFAFLRSSEVMLFPGPQFN